MYHFLQALNPALLVKMQLFADNFLFVDVAYVFIKIVPPCVYLSHYQSRISTCCFIEYIVISERACLINGLIKIYVSLTIVYNYLEQGSVAMFRVTEVFKLCSPVW